MACYLIYRNGELNSLALEPSDRDTPMLFVEEDGEEICQASASNTIPKFISNNSNTGVPWAARLSPPDKMITVMKVLEEALKDEPLLTSKN